MGDFALGSDSAKVMTELVRLAAWIRPASADSLPDHEERYSDDEQE